MSTYTKNIKLEIPDYTDNVDIPNLMKKNNNIIDENIAKIVKLNCISDTEITGLFQNFKYYNKSTNSIYIYDSEGVLTTEDPQEGVVYINLDDECLYYYRNIEGGQMIKASSSNKGIYIGSEEPTDEDVNFWINPDENSNVVENIISKSNENGNYVKFPDGTLINYGMVYFKTGESTSKIITFAHPFIDNNYGFSITCAWNYKNKIIHTTSPGEKDKITLNLYDETGAEISTNQQVRYIAVGRWEE